MTAQRRFVAVVDDDESIRHSLPDLLRLMGFEAAAFDSAMAFLESGALGRADCLILDIAMPGMSGPELMDQAAVKARGTPIIFITALLDDTARRKLLDQGAVECLFKPFSEEALLDALERALGGG